MEAAKKTRECSRRKSGNGKKRKMGSTADDPDDRDYDPKIDRDRRGPNKKKREKPNKKKQEKPKKKSKHEERFDKRLEELAEFKRVHGHTRVPCDQKTKLSYWVQNIRQEYRKLKNGEESTLDAHRLVKLTEAEFVFKANGGFTPWEDRMKALKAFHAQHGHVKVPVNGTALGKWVGHVRRAYKDKMSGKKTSLTDERQKELEDLGFVWLAGNRMPEGACQNRKSWETRFEEFKQYKAAHGHAYVPQHNPGGLGSWVAEQRQYYKKYLRGEKTYITAEKIMKLSNEGFVWDAKGLGRTPATSVAGAQEEQSTDDDSDEV